MGLIRPELSELSALELERCLLIWEKLCTFARTSDHSDRFFILNFRAGRDAQPFNILSYVHFKDNASFFFILKPLLSIQHSVKIFLSQSLNLLFKTLKLIGIALSLNDVCFAL